MKFLANKTVPSTLYPMRWPAYTHVFFDCDSTLAKVEGIDVLAEKLQKGGQIKALTDAAMNGSLNLQDVYAQRLETIKPTRAQVQAIRQAYKNNIVEDAAEVVQTLQQLGHQVYIISGGLLDPVREFGVALGVPTDHICAVRLEYNLLSGDWWKKRDEEEQDRWDSTYLQYKAGALTLSDGKAQIIRELLDERNGRPGRSLLIGDGSSDLLAKQAVDLFVGFGGVVKRQIVESEAPAFVHSASLAPLLLLAAGPAAVHRLHPSQQKIFYKAFQLFMEGAITFQDERLKTKFYEACQTVYSRTH